LQLSELEGGNEKADSAPKESKPEVSYEIAANKEKAVLAPEEVFFEGPPSWTEMVIPGISILTVIGIVPFIATATRQAWVKYKITSRRISVTSGFNGQVRLSGWRLTYFRSHSETLSPSNSTLFFSIFFDQFNALFLLSKTCLTSYVLKPQDLTEITYDEIFGMKFVYRGFGATGDVVIELRDGAKLEVSSERLLG
jgi:hypothetical protein